MLELRLALDPGSSALIDEATDRVLAGWKHPLINDALVRRAVNEEARKGTTIMFKLVKAGNSACEAALTAPFCETAADVDD